MKSNKNDIRERKWKKTGMLHFLHAFTKGWIVEEKLDSLFVVLESIYFLNGIGVSISRNWSCFYCKNISLEGILLMTEYYSGENQHFRAKNKILGRVLSFLFLLRKWHLEEPHWLPMGYCLIDIEDTWWGT